MKTNTLKSIRNRTVKIKKVLKITGIVLAVAALLLVIVLLTLSSLVKSGIETFGPVITGVPVKINSLTINPVNGIVSIRNFVVGNPKGYESPHAVKLEKFHVDVDMSTLAAKKLVIEKIQVNGLEVNYETLLLTDNIRTIQANVNRNTGADKASAEKEEKTLEKAPSGGKPLQINYLELKDIRMWVVVKGTKARVPLMLPPIVLRDLGTGPEGVSSAKVINDVLLSMLGSMGKALKADMVAKGLQSGATQLGQSAGDAAAKLGKSVGDAASFLGDAASSLLGGKKKK